MEEPKKPQNAYWIFLSENREAIQKEMGTKNIGVIGKQGGERWKKLSEQQKAPYEKKAKDAKAAYESALEKFKAGGGVVGKRRQEKADAKREKEGGKRRKREKDPNAPKKPQTAYWMWMNDNRDALTKELGTKDVTAVGKLAGERWRALDAKLKAPFEKKAKDLKDAYDKALKEYKATKGDAEADDEEEEDEADEASN